MPAMQQRKSNVVEQPQPSGLGDRLWRFLLILLPPAILLSRLAFLLNGNAYLDGDESLYGVMTLHVLQGKGLPILPYGQGYGVSVIETLIMAGYASLLGLTPTVMQLSMLSLWALAMVFFALAVRRFAGDLAAVVSTALLILSPGWGHVSLASWGYNQTAFLATNISLWLIANLIHEDQRRPGPLLGLGIAVGMVSVTQPIYVLGLAPFLLLLVVCGRRFTDAFHFGVGFAVVAGLFILVRALGRVYWQPQLFDSPDVFAALWLIPQRLWVVLSGAYFLDRTLPFGPATLITATLWSFCALALAVQLVLRSRRDRSFTPSHAGFLAVSLVLLFSLVVTPADYGYRYGVPAIGFLCLALGIELSALLDARKKSLRIFARVLLAVILFGGAVSLIELGGLNFSGSAVRSRSPEDRDLQTLVDYLLQRKIRHVFCTDGMFQWKLIFISHEGIQTRFLHSLDRYTVYPQAVEQALYSDQPVAIVHEGTDARKFTELVARAGFGYLRVELVANRYVVLQNPPLELLQPWFQNTKPQR